MRACFSLIVAGALLLVSCASTAQEDSTSTLEINRFIQEVDVSGDGVMSHAEWFGVGLPQSAFGVLDKDRDDAVTSEEMHAEAPPPGIDLDGDGGLTLEEFLEFDRRMRANMPPQQ